jgi:hypothetical protein
MSRSQPPTSARRPSHQPSHRVNATLITWGSVVLVIVVIAVLVIVRITGGSGPTISSHQAVRPASPSLVRQLSTIPSSTFDTIGVDIPAEFAGDRPIVISGQPPLTLDGSAPTLLYYGAEYCPYCAAERWGMAVALARFGTWHGLDTTASGLLDGDVSTLSFRTATLTSSTIHVVPVETCTNVVAPGVAGCDGYKPLQTPTKEEQAVLAKYAGPTFVPGDTDGIAFPFIDVDNKVLFSGSTYEPTVLTGMSQAQIASSLSDTASPVTRSIIGTANYITAAVCASTKGAPASVCDSAGVRAADSALGLAPSGG